MPLCIAALWDHDATQFLFTVHCDAPMAGHQAAAAHHGCLPTLRWPLQVHHSLVPRHGPPWSACELPWFASCHWVHVGITCTTMVPALGTHSSLQPSVPSHSGGSCPGVTSHGAVHMNPLRPTAVTTVEIVCVTFHRGRCVHPHRPPAAPSCPLHLCGFTVELTHSTVVEWCAREPR